MRFLPDEPDYLLPGRLYMALENEFPVTEHLGNPILPGLASPTGPFSLPVIRFLNSARTIFFQYGPGLLSLHAVRPYVGYPEFEKAADLLVRKLLEMVPTARIQRLGFRNLNRFSFPDGRINLDENFNIRFMTPAPEGALVNQISISFQLTLPSTARLLRIWLRSQESAEPEVVLDLDCFEGLDEPGSPERVIAWISESHDIVGDAFESCLSQQAKSKLEPIP